MTDQGLQRELQRLQQSEARLRLLLDSLKDYAIVTLDPAGRIETWNRGAGKAFGYTADEVLGQPFDILFTPEDRALGVPAMELRQAREEQSSSDQRWLRRKDGSTFFADGTVSPLEDDSGVLSGFVKIARDVTERRRYEEGLRRTQDELTGRVAQRTSELATANVSLEAETLGRRSGEERVRSLLRRLVTVQEDERRRIARDLHDHLGQLMTALRLNLDALKGGRESGDADERVENADRIASRLEADVDFLAWELRPAGIDELGLPATLQRFIREWSHHYGIDGEFHASGIDRERLGVDVEINLYRIAQEALNNVYKHAKATCVDMILERRQNNIVLIVEDNGSGFDPGQTVNGGMDRGLGLVGMRERASLAGGTLDVESGPGRGTTIFVRIPLPPVQP
jgi:PAS domain S-box-containing protein